MWTITGVEHPRADFDGEYHRWNLERGAERSFVLVRITGHARMKVGDRMAARSIEAVDTQAGPRSNATLLTRSRRA
jgi:hypothetical protein